MKDEVGTLLTVAILTFTLSPQTPALCPRPSSANSHHDGQRLLERLEGAKFRDGRVG